MILEMPKPLRRRIEIVVVIAAIVAVTVVILRWQGRVWFCSCGEIKIWAGDIWSLHNSQHLFDPYSFTHIAHGLLFALLFIYVPPFRGWSRRTAFADWRLPAGVAIEALWEIVENSAWIINRYREATLALGYNGDSITNSVADIACFIFGFILASRIKWYYSLAIFAVMEIVLALTIRDNLTLNVIMLIWPMQSIKAWQMAIAP